VLHTGDRDDVIETTKTISWSVPGRANSYITKPVNLSLFEETVKQIEVLAWIQSASARGCI